jgi:hypothetical protein
MWLHRFFRRWRPRHLLKYPLLFEVEGAVKPRDPGAAESSGPDPQGHSQTDDFPPGSTRSFLLGDQGLNLTKEVRKATPISRK